MKNGSVHRFGAYHYHSASEIDDYQIVGIHDGIYEWFNRLPYGRRLRYWSNNSKWWVYKSVFQGFLVGV